MKFSPIKFLKLSRERKLKKIYDWLLLIEKSNLDNSEVNNLKELVIEIPELANIEELNNFCENPRLEYLQKAIMRYEAFMGKDVKDQNIMIFKDDSSDVSMKFPIIPVLNDLRSAFNVGSIFRTSECFGAEKVILSGYTQCPNDKKVKKSAMGVENYLVWEKEKNVSLLIAKYKEKGFKIYALETANPSTSLYEAKFEFPAILLLGNEALGISEENLKLCHEVIRIPMFGNKNSLNVGVAYAVTISEMRKQWEDDQK